MICVDTLDKKIAEYIWNPLFLQFGNESGGGLNKEISYSQASHDRINRNSYLYQNNVQHES